MSLLATIENRYSNGRSLRSQGENELDLITQYVYPMSKEFTVGANSAKGDSRQSKIFDNTAANSLEDLSGYIATTLAPPGVDWLMLLPDDPDLLDDKTTIKYLDKASRKISKYLFRSEVRFHLASDEAIMECSGLGTGCIHIREEKDDRGNKFLLHQSVPMSELVFEENHMGVPDVVFRSRSITAKQILEQYVYVDNPSHRMDDSMIEDLKEMATSGDPNHEFELIHAVFPKSDLISGMMTKKVSRKYGSVHIFTSGANNDDDKKAVLREADVDFNPYIVFRFRKRSGESWGYGPGHRALPDTRALQKMRKTNLEAGEISVAPPMDVPTATYKNKLNLASRAMNYRKRFGTNADRRAEPMLLSNGIPIGLEMEDRTREIIKEALYSGEIKESKVGEMSATETGVRQMDRLKLMSPQLTRIITEWLHRNVMIVYDWMLREKLLDEEPEKLKKSGLSPVYVSELIRAMFANELIAIERLFASVANISNVDNGETANTIDKREIAMTLVQKSRLPLSWVKSQETIEEERQRETGEETGVNSAKAAKDASTATLNIAKARQLEGLPI